MLGKLAADSPDSPPLSLVLVRMAVLGARDSLPKEASEEEIAALALKLVDRVCKDVTSSFEPTRAEVILVKQMFSELMDELVKTPAPRRR